jgi:DNA-binding transcriptional LysR family regulator
MGRLVAFEFDEEFAAERAWIRSTASLPSRASWKSGSFSAAARRMNISKSAISAHVQRLEERLGIRLLNRTTRRLSLTEAGAAYYRHCARILVEAEAAEQAASAL